MRKSTLSPASQNSARGLGPPRESPAAARIARIYLIASATFLILGIGYAAGLWQGIRIGGQAVASAVIHRQELAR